MSELQDIILKINELKEKLTQLIDEKQDLLDSEVISASKKLDEALNEYEMAIRQKCNNNQNNKANNHPDDINDKI
ncbi:MAG: aspartyl-phosphate phosphatase Spo0E family protein [Firmicutes bacterium]|nr:aspartyl-phosphate phosphatase Spo0E family protein [Bacillota bacterium]